MVWRSTHAPESYLVNNTERLCSTTCLGHKVVDLHATPGVFQSFVFMIGPAM